MAVTIHPKIVDVVVEAAIVADLRRADEKAVLVVMELAAFPVVVAQIDKLRRKALDRKVLAKQIGDEDVVAPQLLGDRVEAAVGVLFDAAEIAEVVLPAVGLTVAEEAYPE